MASASVSDADSGSAIILPTQQTRHAIVSIIASGSLSSVICIRKLFNVSPQFHIVMSSRLLFYQAGFLQHILRIGLLPAELKIEFLSVFCISLFKQVAEACCHLSIEYITCLFESVEGI